MKTFDIRSGDSVRRSIVREEYREIEEAEAEVACGEAVPCRRIRRIRDRSCKP